MGQQQRTWQPWHSEMLAAIKTWIGNWFISVSAIWFFRSY